VTHAEVINKLASEMCAATGHPDLAHIYRWYLRQALDIGINHFSPGSEEVLIQSISGAEIGRYNSIKAAAKVLNIDERNIHRVLKGKAKTAGGYRFVLAKDQDPDLGMPCLDTI
jgi:hypothetical protein